MGKISQRKKRQRVQRKQRENRYIEVHPASIPAIVRRDQPKPLTLLTIPLEIRFKIYSTIAHGSHVITIAPNLHIYSPLTGLIHSHPQLENEIEEWRKCYPRPSIHPVFGDFDPNFTTFKITFRSNEQIVTRIYPPPESKWKLLVFELWKRAMDMVGTDKQFQVNRAISYLTRRLWEWKPEMGPKKNTREFREMQEHMQFLLFDESHGLLPVMDAGRRYEEPLGEKFMPNVKPDLVYRKVYGRSDDLSCYYRSLGVDAKNLAAVGSVERVRASWILKERNEDA